VIPPLNLSGVLPPFLGPSPSVISVMSPYVTSMGEIAQRFCKSSERVNLFRGLVAYRKALLAIGISQGVQWIDGSFCEDVESILGRPPGDIDLVSLFIRPPHATVQADWQAFFVTHINLFSNVHTKPSFGCDAFTVDVGLPAYQVFPQITYWFGLFTHQRATLLWKGLLQVPLVSDDDAAIAYVNTLVFTP
jgi:hypothetical protein